MISEKRLARTAGVLYLVVALFGGFAELMVRAGIVVPGNAPATSSGPRSCPPLPNSSERGETR